MTQHPFDSSELGRLDSELDHVAAGLERYAAAVADEPPAELVARVRAAVDAEPLPRAPFAAFATWAGPIRAIGTAGLAALVLAGALAIGQLVQESRQGSGSSPTPTMMPTPSPTPTPTPSATPTSSPSPSPSPSPSVSPGQSSDGAETPEPVETEHPDGSDNSGPGGGGSGGSDSSAPGGGGDSGSDSSGPGG